MSLLQNGCTQWTLTKCIEKKPDGNYTRMLCAVSNKSWKQHSVWPLTSHLTNHPSKMNKTWLWWCGHFWRCKDRLISNVLFLTPAQGHPSVGWLAKTYLHQLCVDTGCSLEDLPGAMDDRDRESGTLCYLHNLMMMIYIYIYIYICVCVYVYMYVSLNNKDKFCLYNLFKILSSFLISVLVSGWNW